MDANTFETRAKSGAINRVKILQETPDACWAIYAIGSTIDVPIMIELVGGGARCWPDTEAARRWLHERGYRGTIYVDDYPARKRRLDEMMAWLAVIGKNTKRMAEDEAYRLSIAKDLS